MSGRYLNQSESRLLSTGTINPEDNQCLSLYLPIILITVALGSASAIAQSQPAQSGPSNNAVNSSDHNNSNAPVAGRNSFTEGQAKSKFEAAGYSNVSDLQKDDDRVWRGKAD